MQSTRTMRRASLILLLLLHACHVTAGQRGDIRARVNAPGVTSVDRPKREWADSYSVNGVCYCASNYKGIGGFAVPVGNGFAQVQTVCRAIGPGPGINTPGAILYNTIQCGNWPAKNKSSREREHECPGRVDVSATNTGCPGVQHLGCREYLTRSPALACFVGRSGRLWSHRAKVEPERIKNPY